MCLRRRADEDIAHRILGAMENGFGHRVGRIDGRRIFRLHIEIISGMLLVRSIDRGRFDQSHGNRSIIGLELHAESIGKSFNGVFRCAVNPLERNRSV